MALFTRRDFLIAGAASLATLASCNRPNPDSPVSGVEPTQQSVTATPEPTPVVENVVESELLYGGERYIISAEDLPNVTFWPISFARTLAFIREKVVGKSVFDPDSIASYQGNITLAAQPRGTGARHDFTIYYSASAQMSNVEGLALGYTILTFVDPEGNSVSNIPSGPDDRKLRSNLIETLFNIAVDPQADGHFATEDSLSKTLAETYAVAYLAAEQGLSYNDYIKFKNQMGPEGYVPQVTLEAYVELTQGIADFSLPALFTIQAVQ